MLIAGGSIVGVYQNVGIDKLTLVNAHAATHVTR
jgi:hypothetical protein